MGKIKKIKAERKRAEVEHQIKKAKNKRLIFKLVFLLALIFALTGIGAFGYKKYGGNLTTIVNKITKKETHEQTQGGSSTQERKVYTKAPDMQIDVNKTYVAKFETNKGNFEINLFAKDAPKTVNNFVVLSRDGFYNGLTFHRIIKDFMIQGGDPNCSPSAEGSGQTCGSGGPGYKFEDEINSHKLVRGTLAMANSGANTNGSQFFIVTKEATDWLDGKHTAFGEVTNGLDVVMNIEKVEVGENDKPKKPIVINSISIEEK